MGSDKSAAEDAGPPQAVVTIAALVAGIVAQRVVSAGWKFVRGSDPDKEDSPLPELLIFAAVSAATVAVAKSWVSNRAAKKFSPGTS
jgi:hypothetical protein